MSWSKIVSTRRSNVLSLPLQWRFPGLSIDILFWLAPQGEARLHCFVLSVPLVAAARTFAVKVGTSIDRPVCLVGPPALLVHLPCQPACLVGQSVFLCPILALALLEGDCLPTNMPWATKKCLILTHSTLRLTIRMFLSDLWIREYRDMDGEWCH